MAKVISVFVSNLHLSPSGVQLLAGFTTFLMVLRFVLDYNRHRSISAGMRTFLLMLDAATYALLHYSLGVMQRPSWTNSYYQVWAVLLVTLRYSVKHGRPAGVALKQTPLVDLMSSFWAANILRSHAPRLLKIPVWLLWSINSARIIHGFVSSEHGTAEHRENVRLVTEYMRPKTRSSAAAAQPATMAGYNYLVLGEAKQRKKVRPPHYRLELELTNEEELITVDKIWEWSKDDDQMRSGHGRRVSELLNQREGNLKDLCLSFALYKLLRRRFFNLPIHESNLQETKRLIFHGILNPVTTVPSATARVEAVNPSGSPSPSSPLGEVQSTDDHHPIPNYKRALRIAKVELAFVNDFFFSRHALMFATGFPFLRLLLSTLLVGAISYMAVAIHRFSKTATEDELGRVRVHHGVFFTWILLTLLGVKEMIEIVSYVFSDWTKVMLLCKYVRQPWWLRGPAMAMLVRLLCRYSLVRRWDEKIGQYNLIFSVGRRHIFEFTEFSEEMQKAIFVSLSSLRDRPDIQPSERRPPYVDRALSVIPTEGKDALKTVIDKLLEDLKGDARGILLWHIATCYCECHLADKRDIDVSRPWIARILCYCLPTYKRARIWTGPFIQPSKLGSSEDGRAPSFTKNYITAVRLSQYCAHLLRLTPALIPGNDITSTAVLDEVIRETRQALKGCFSLKQTFEKLEVKLQSQNIEGSTGEEANQQDDQESTELEEICQDDQGSTGEEANQQDHQESIEFEEIYQDDQGSTGEEANQQDDQESVGNRENDAGNKRTLLKMGSELGQELLIRTNYNDEVLWKFLAELWAGFVLHLAESTRASKHKIYLSRGGDLLTHLWALLSHAGFMGSVDHGEIGSGEVQNSEVQRQDVDFNN